MRDGDVNENPKGISFWALVAEDLRTHDRDLTRAGFWALLVHRLGNQRMSVKSKLLRGPLTVLYFSAYRAVIALWGIDLSYNIKIGRRFCLKHHGCIHIGAWEIGDDVVIRNSATIGLLRRTSRQRAPIIGNRVEVGPGAAIVGNIEIGDDCYIGANTLVADSLPNGSQVLGVPARLVLNEEDAEARAATRPVRA